MGNSIEIDPSTVRHDNNWIGVACCVIFRIGNESGNYQPYDFCCPKTPPIHLESDLVVMDQSDHMWLFYLSAQGFYDIFIEDIQYHTSDDTKSVEVKKYGYRWVYE